MSILKALDLFFHLVLLRKRKKRWVTQFWRKVRVFRVFFGSIFLLGPGKNWNILLHPSTAQCAVDSVYFSAQPNKLRPILKFEVWYHIVHIFVPAYSSVRKLHFFTFLWFSNSRSVISPKICPCIYPFFLLYQIQGHTRYRGIVLNKVHIAQ